MEVELKIDQRSFDLAHQTAINEPCAHDAADVTDREVATDCGGAACASPKNGVARLEQSDAFCFGLRPVDHPVCFC
jgi:hypothetical protein